MQVANKTKQRKLVLLHFTLDTAASPTSEADIVHCATFCLAAADTSYISDHCLSVCRENALTFLSLRPSWINKQGRFSELTGASLQDSDATSMSRSYRIYIIYNMMWIAVD